MSRTFHEVYYPVTVTLHDGPHGIMLAVARDDNTHGDEGVTYAASESSGDALGAAAYVHMSHDGMSINDVHAYVSHVSAEHACGMALAMRGGWDTCHTCEGEGHVVSTDHACYGDIACPACGGYGILGVIR